MKTAIILLVCVCALVKSEKNCSSHSTSCDECIRESGCGWDFSPDFPLTESRCKSPIDLSKISNLEHAYNPENQLAILEMRPVGDDVWLSPQKLKIILRLHEPVIFTVNFKETDALPPQHLENLLVEYARDEAKKVHVNFQAISCPKDPKNFKQNLKLTSYQSNQTLSIEIDILCSCPPP